MSEFSKETLANSEKVIGQLYPALVNQEGKVLEGNHRLASNPNWRKKIVETKTKLEDILVRMHAHHRRRIPQEETQALLIELAQELEKGEITKENVASELVKIAPYSDSYIRRLLPVEYKQFEKVEAGKISAELSQHPQIQVKNDDVSTPEKPEVGIKPSMDKVKPRKFLAEQITCHGCQMSTRLFPELYKQIDGELYCDKCAPNVKPQRKVKPQITEPAKHKESWTERKAHMAPQISRMEASIADQLVSKELSFQSQTKFCLQSTTPDFYFPKQNVAVYLDGVEVHKNRQDKDEALRELLTKRHGVRVLSIPYKGTSQKAQDMVLAEILEVVQSG